ncbi:hypothetical protein CLOP_g16350 [Closterium sp. NIES-67]|nr:hypothetical protein CLOP_g16350 [Closterium sp. NIES-67]
MAEPAESTPGPVAKPAGEETPAPAAEPGAGPTVMSVAAPPAVVSLVVNKPVTHRPCRLRMGQQQLTHPDQQEQVQPRETQARSVPPRRRAFWLTSLGSLLGRKVAGLLWPALHKLALRLLVDALGFAVGLTASLAAGCVLLDRRRSFDVGTPQVRRVLAVTDEAHLDRLRGSLPGWVKDPGLEPARWLNHVIARFWHVLDPALSKVFVNKLWPAICRRKGLPEDLLQIQSFSFGSFPLVVEYVKVVDSHESAATFDIKLHLATNSNARAILTLPRDVLKLPANEDDSGCASTLQLSHFVGSAIMRMSFSPLVPRFPCFGGVQLSFMENPDIDFCLSTYAGFDLMALPGTSYLLRRKMRSSIAGRMLWPYRCTIRTKAAVAMDMPRRAVGTVTVEIVEATGLTQAGIFMSQNILYPSPFVKAYIDSSHAVCTATESFTCDPVWREVVRLPVNDHETDALTFEVHDATALLVEGLIGSCVLHVSNLQPGTPQHFTLGLWSNRGLPCGELELIATFRILQSETMPRKLLSEDSALAKPGMPPRLQILADGPGLLEVAVWRGLDLDASSWMGRNPEEAQFLCKLFLAGEERVTKVAEGRGNPQWEESFEFLLDHPPATEKLLVEVWNRMPEAMLVASADKLVGSVEIPLCDVLKNKRIVDLFQLRHTKQGI